MTSMASCLASVYVIERATWTRITGGKLKFYFALLIISVMLRRHRWWMNPKSANAPNDSKKMLLMTSMGRQALIDGM